MPVDWTAFWADLESLYQKEDGNLNAYQAELPVLQAALPRIAEALDGTYEFVKPLGRGGAGIVITLMDKHLTAYRALKLPRPREEELVDSIRNEIDHLTQLRHEHIIRVYDLGAVPLGIATYKLPYPYFVMEYIDGVQSLRAKAQHLLDSVTTARDLPAITTWLADKLYAIARAVTYLHEHSTIHFDIKPANILIDTEDKPTLSDLGFAKRKVVGGPEAIVGFTLFYAHPDLRSTYQHMSSQNRVRRPLAPDGFKYSWDIYAFGRTLLEILALIDSYFPDAVPYDYTFVYLHLLACRALDGRNLTSDDTKRIRARQAQAGEPITVYRETWLDLTAPDFSSLS